MVPTPPDRRRREQPTRLRRALTAALAHPARWAWPVAVVLICVVPRRSEWKEFGVRWYLLPALLLVLLGCLPSLRGRRTRAVRARPTLLPRTVLVWSTAAVLAAAVALRLWGVTDWPPQGIGFEEFELGQRANDLTGGAFDKLVTLYTRPLEHTLTAYAVSLSFTMFGTGFLEMRLPFILGGIVSPFLFFAVCRRLVAWEPALFALALFAVSWWQIAASRVADEIFFPIWVVLATLWLLLRFEDTAESWAAFGLGLCSGLLIYEYSAYHLMVPLVAGYCAARLAWVAMPILRASDPWTLRRRRLLATIREYAPGAVAMLLVWVILARLQLMRDIRRGMGSWMFEGIRRHGTTGVLGRLDGLADFSAFAGTRLSHALHAFYTPGFFDSAFRYLGLGLYPAFDPITAAAIGLGALLTAVTSQRRFHTLVLVWIAVILLGGALLPGNENTDRYYVALPLLYLLVAFGADVLWGWFPRPASRTALVVVFALAAIAAAAANVQHLFWQLMPDQQLRTHWIWPRTEIARWIRDHPRDAPICVVATDENSGITGPNPLNPEWAFLVDGWTVRTVPTLGGCLPSEANGGPAHYVVLALPDPPSDLLEQLRRGYPAARELAPIVVPLHQFVARTFSTLPAQPANPRPVP